MFTDDDVMVDRYWLSNIEKAFEEHDVSCVGGKILPVWEIPKPEWLIPPLHYILALLDRGDTPFHLESPIVWGANFAIRSDIFEKYGVFDTKLGRIPERLFAGEETHLVRKLLLGGERVLYYPDAVVYHCIPKERISKKYFRQWKYDQGILRGSLRGNSKHESYSGIPGNPLVFLIKNTLLFFKDLKYLPQRRFVFELRIISYAGFILKRISDKKLFSRFFKISI